MKRTLLAPRLNFWLLFSLALWCAFGSKNSYALLDDVTLLEDVPIIGQDFAYRLNFTQTQNNTQQPAPTNAALKQLNKQLRKTLNAQRKASASFALFRQKPYAARFDRAILQQWLESEGYLSAKIRSDLSGKRIQHHINLGQRFTIAEVTITAPERVPTPSEYLLPLQPGMPLSAQKVLDSTQALKTHIEANSCLFSLKVSYLAQVDYNQHLAYITLQVEAGQEAVFAQPKIAGNGDIASEFLQKAVLYKPGDCYKKTLVEKSRLALLQTNLVARAEPIISAPVAGEVHVTFHVQPRKHRTIKAGAGYNTDTGANLLLGWQHRNILGSGQKLDTHLNASKVEQSLNGELTLPNYLRGHQTLTLATHLTHETPAAYTALQGDVSAILSRPLRRRWSASVGAALEFSRIKKEGEEGDYALLSAPVGLDYTTVDHIFDPTQGWALSLKARPQVNLYQTGIRFMEYSALGRAYISNEHWPLQPTLAARFGIGIINGSSLDDVPADHRFYSGGGGSVRGYDYQSLGVLEGTEPTGGLSFSEISTELRLKINEQWGAVLFADGGFAFGQKHPKVLDEYLWAAGIGIRYFTSFAPIRLDIARPLDIRRVTNSEGNLVRIDSPFQIYINIGQTF